MKGLWDELYSIVPLGLCSYSGWCSCDSNEKSVKRKQGRRVVQFLMKLDSRYQQTRSNILIMKDLPSPAEAYRILMQEQTHQNITKFFHCEQETPMACCVEKRKYYDKNKQNKEEHQKIHHTFVFLVFFFVIIAKFMVTLWKDIGSFMDILLTTSLILG